MEALIQKYLSTKDNPLYVAKQLAQPIAFEKLAEKIACCKQCKKCSRTSEAPFIWGNYNASILIVLPSHSSSAKEMKYLAHLLKSYNIDPDCIAYTYAVQGVFYEKKYQRPPLLEEAEKCANFTRTIVDIVEPLAIICFSNLSNNMFYYEPLTPSKAKPSFIRNIPIFNPYSIKRLLDYYYGTTDKDKALYEEKNAQIHKEVSRCLKYLSEYYPQTKIFLD